MRCFHGQLFDHGINDQAHECAETPRELPSVAAGFPRQDLAAQAFDIAIHEVTGMLSSSRSFEAVAESRTGYIGSQDRLRM